MTRPLFDVAAAAAGVVEPDGFVFWGSDCRECGNTTPDDMRCDECGRDDTTFALFFVAGSD